MRENLVNVRMVTFDNKDCSMSTQYVRTDPLGLIQNGYICITPKEFNRGYVKYQDAQCKKSKSAVAPLMIQTESLPSDQLKPISDPNAVQE